MDNWQRFWRLSRLERRLLLRATVLLPVTGFALSLVGFQRWRAILVGLAPKAPKFLGVGNETPEERGVLTARMVRAAERHGWGRPNCLRQSLVLWCLLRRQGIAAALRIGVRKREGALEAHAWVEHGGVVLNEDEDVHKHYIPFEGSLAAASPGSAPPQ